MSGLGAIVETGTIAAVEIAASALAEQGHDPKPCPNCSKPLIGPYCAICGQPINTHRRSLKHLIHEFVKDIVSFDSRILRTGRALLLQPGELPKAFREGRTQPFVPAVRLYLFVSLLFFLFLAGTGIAVIQFDMNVSVTTLIHDKQGHVIQVADGQRKVLPGLRSDDKGNISFSDPKVPGVILPNKKADGKTFDNTITSPPRFFQPIGSVHSRVTPELKKAIEEIKTEGLGEEKKQGWMTSGVYLTLKKLESDPAALNGPLTTWIPRILFVLLPLFAVLLAVFYLRQRKDYLFVDHLVFSLTFHSFAFVVLIAAAAVAQVFSGGWVAVIAWLVLSVYFLISLKRFYGQGWFITSVKSAGITFIYAVFFLFPALVSALVLSVVAGA